MKQLRTILHSLLMTAAALLVLLAVASVVTRWLIADLDGYRGGFASLLSLALDLDVGFGALEGRLHGFTPVIAASDLVLARPEHSDQRITVGHAEVELDILDSLMAFKPRIAAVRLSGASFVVVTDAERKLYVHGLGTEWPLPEGGGKGRLAAGLAAAVSADGVPAGLPGRFSLHLDGADVEWRDEVSGLVRRFDEVQLAFEPSANGVKLSVGAELPPELGRSIHFTARLASTEIPGSPAQSLSEQSAEKDPGTADFYLKTEQLNVGGLYPLTGKEPRREGRLDAELWATVDRGHGLRTLSGTLALDDYRDPAMMHFGEIESLRTGLVWEAGEEVRKLGLIDFAMRTPDAVITGTDIGVIQTGLPDAMPHTAVSFRLEALDHGTLAWLIAGLQRYLGAPGSAIPVDARLDRSDVTLRFAHGRDWILSPGTWPPLPALDSGAAPPQFSGMDGNVALFDIKLHFPQWFDGPRALKRASAHIAYRREGGGAVPRLDQIEMVTDDGASLSGSASLSDAGADAQAEVKLVVEDLPVARIADWIPRHRLKPALDAWLRGAFVEGRVSRAELELQGNMAAFPFADGGGRWSARAAVVDAVLNYRPGRPPLRELNAEVIFENESLRVHSSGLRFMDSYSDAATATISDMRRPYLEVNARTRGPFTDVFSYLKTAGLLDPANVAVSNIEPRGEVHLELNVQTPLSEAVQKETRVSGGLDFAGAEIDIAALGLGFDEIRGRLHFDRNGGRAERLDAKIGDYPAVIRARPQQGATVLDVTAAMPPYPAFSQFAPWMEEFVSGSASWGLELTVPGLGPDASQPLQLELSSNLHGLAVGLPVPLGKAATGTGSFMFKTDIGGAHTRYAIDYGGLLRLHLERSRSGRLSGELRFSPQMAYSPPEIDDPETFKVRGVIPEAAFDEWWGWWRARSGDDDDAAPAVLDHVNVVVQQAVWNRKTLGEMHLETGRTDDGDWSLKLDSEVVKGRVTQSSGSADGEGGERDRRVEMELEHLFLDEGMFSAPSGGSPAPATLPQLAVKISEFRLGDLAVSDVDLLTEPVEQGMKISRLYFTKLNGDRTIMKTRFEGSWIHDDAERSHFRFVMRSEDYGALLKSWGFNAGLEGGEGTVSGNLFWSGRPMDFAPGVLEGEVKLKIKDGVIKTVEPGAGRLLGILNISEIARRFTLDFKDVFDEGLVFDKLRGELQFKKGDMIARRFEIKGPALALAIRGRTGIIARDYDQEIDVVPNLSSNIPLATALIGGPLAGLAVYLIGKTTDIGDKVDEIITLRYTLKGSWDAPEIEFIEAPKVNKFNPGDKLKSLFENLMPGGN